MDAPLARALLGKARDAEVSVEAGDRRLRYVIVAIDYE
jgi:transcription elongation GreA/GreB family factor